jgi:acyl-CoA dehydrogenase
MSFFQDPPALPDPLRTDPLLQEYLERTLSPSAREGIAPELTAMAETAQRFYRRQGEDRLNEPELTQWDAWGNRIDEIVVSPLWREAAVLAAQAGLVATAYERKLGPLARVHMFVLNYLVEASLDVYSCPLAMTDGAARTLLDTGNRALIDRAVPRLTSRDPATMWTSGQWMTERTGGSDVGLSETVARQDADGWRLFGTKWFTSATTSQMALTLARPEGNGPGGRGLALFYVELKDAQGRWNGISVNRLKDKLGTRKVPTAELTLDGARAIPVTGTADGIRNITPMLSITRLWNANGAVAGMRRAIALATDYARRRVQFGARLVDKPLHRDTLATLEAEQQAGFLLTYRGIELLGRREAGVASPEDDALLRVITPLAKLVTGKQAVAVASEALECFGGAGYVEDTGLPRMLRDAQVLPIWEGTTNVLSLDVLRAIAKGDALEALAAEVKRRTAVVKDPSVAGCAAAALAAMERAHDWLAKRLAGPPGEIEGGARRFALTVGRSLALALLAHHAQWALEHGHGPRAAAAARQFLRNGVDHLGDDRDEDARLLVPAT